MKLPANKSSAAHRAGRSEAPAVERAAEPVAVRPQGCCVEHCVSVPGVGRVCHCSVSGPFC